MINFLGRRTNEWSQVGCWQINILSARGTINGSLTSRPPTASAIWRIQRNIITSFGLILQSTEISRMIFFRQMQHAKKIRETQPSGVFRKYKTYVYKLCRIYDNRSNVRLKTGTIGRLTFAQFIGVRDQVSYILHIKPWIAGNDPCWQLTIVSYPTPIPSKIWGCSL